jgi:hypothetical protein
LPSLRAVAQKTPTKLGCGCGPDAPSMRGVKSVGATPRFDRATSGSPDSIQSAGRRDRSGFAHPGASRSHDRVTVTNVRVRRSLGMRIDPARNWNAGLEAGLRFTDQIAAFFELQRASIRDAAR